ncbi:adenosylcobinamide-GDP ribazoletransferase [Allohahella marinimesophila]|uniref:Adenosylcobinamide-GDP ribazoletransferase n=1 Tax=Allohahella marinimesophila TaxID=1054972 RepID=A0ABP7PE81_9GAMM
MNSPPSSQRQGLRYELHLCAVAFQFYSRVPVRLPLAFDHTDLNACTRYFPVVGAGVGLTSGLVFLLICAALGSQQAFAAAVLAVACSALLTGAFHEDGLADMADGLGGGQTVQQRLTIMKDSRIGTYGALALLLATLLRISLVSALATQSAGLALAILVAAAVASRSNAALLIGILPYAREDASSKVRPVAHSLSPLNRNYLLTLGLASLLLPAFLGPLVLMVLLTVFALAVLLMYFRQALSSRLGGYTGDCLGGLQQLSELAILLILVAGL